MSASRLFVLLALLVTLLAPACSTVPVTGRSQLSFMSLESEMSLGYEAWDQTLAESNLITSGPEYEMVQRIGSRVAEAAIEIAPDPAAQFDWEFILIDDATMANAWALPGGKCAVFTGLLPITEDENGLAIVMGHEVAHAIARHGGERMSQEMAFSGAMLGAGVALNDMDSGDRNLAMAALMGVGTVGVMLPFSRSHESEADHIGLVFAAKAGYDPRAAIGLWQRMGEMAGGAPPEFLSTHPSSDTRIIDLEGWMPEAMEYYDER